MSKPAMPRADFITAVILLVIGIAMLVESLRMPRFEHLNLNPYSIPGIVPALLAAVISLLALILLLRSVRHDGHRRRSADDPIDATQRSGQRRTLLAILITGSYAGGLVGLLPFWLATGLFVFAFIAVFEWDLLDPAARPRMLASAALQAILVAAIVTYIFQEIFLVTLP